MVGPPQFFPLPVPHIKETLKQRIKWFSWSSLPQQAESSEGADRDPSHNLFGWWVGVEFRPILEDSSSISRIDEQGGGELQGRCRDGCYSQISPVLYEESADGKIIHVAIQIQRGGLTMNPAWCDCWMNLLGSILMRAFVKYHIIGRNRSNRRIV